MWILICYALSSLFQLCFVVDFSDPKIQISIGVAASLIFTWYLISYKNLPLEYLSDESDSEFDDEQDVEEIFITTNVKTWECNLLKGI